MTTLCVSSQIRNAVAALLNATVLDDETTVHFFFDQQFITRGAKTDQTTVHLWARIRPSENTTKCL